MKIVFYSFKNTFFAFLAPGLYSSPTPALMLCSFMVEHFLCPWIYQKNNYNPQIEPKQHVSLHETPSNTTSLILSAICSFEFSSWHIVQFTVQVSCDGDCVVLLKQHASQVGRSNIDLLWINIRKKSVNSFVGPIMKPVIPTKNCMLHVLCSFIHYGVFSIKLWPFRHFSLISN